MDRTKDAARCAITHKIRQITTRSDLGPEVKGFLAGKLWLNVRFDWCKDLLCP